MTTTVCLDGMCSTEWIEIAERRQALVIDDSRSAKHDSRTLWKGHRDKGHRACAATFQQAVTDGVALPPKATLAAIQAASSTTRND